MTEGAELHWAASWVLAGLGILPLIAMRAWRKRRPGLIIGTTAPFQTGHGGGLRQRLPLLLELLALVLLVVACARPQLGITRQTRKAEGIDIMLCLDVSGSMRAVDLAGSDEMSRKELIEALGTGDHKTRLQVAREQIEQFIQRRPNDRIGLVVFSDAILTLSPPTLDHDFVRKRLDDVKIGILDQYYQTSIAPPLAAAVTRLKKSDAPRRVIVLLTDGENTVHAAADPLEVARVAAQFNCIVHTVGIGSRTSFIAKDKDMFGRVVWDKFTEEFNPEMLQKIAELTNGQYRAVDDAAMMQKVFNEIDQLEKTDRDTRSYIEYRDLFMPLLAGALGVLLLAILLANTILLRIP